jgi:hypothetical protein
MRQAVLVCPRLLQRSGCGPSLSSGFISGTSIRANRAAGVVFDFVHLALDVVVSAGALIL